MNVYLSHETALEYWRKHPASPKCRNVIRSGSIEDSLSGTRMAQELCLERWASSPYNVLVAQKGLRRVSPLVRNHICSGQLPGGSFARVARHVAVSVPELCFVQMAARLSLPQLVALGYEMCGSYVRRSREDGGFILCEPLMSVGRLRAYLEKLDWLPGLRSARRAQALIADGAASPAEAITTMLLCMPTSLGGYGLELPFLNYPHVLSERAARAADRSMCRCDLFWPKASLCVEYNSDAWHTGPERIARDAIRTNGLIDDGITVIVVTKAQLYDVQAFDDTAHIVAKHLGVRLRIRRGDFESRRAALRRELLSQ